MRRPSRGTCAPARALRPDALQRVQFLPHTYLTHDEVVRLAMSAGDHGTMILVLAYSGLRWGEAVGLRVGYLDMLRRRINVERNAVEVGDRIEGGIPKTHRRRSVPFTATLTVPLAGACKGNSWDSLVFAADNGGVSVGGRARTGRAADGSPRQSGVRSCPD